MSYDKENLEEITLQVIKDYNCIFIEDIMAFIPCSRATWYNHNLDELDSIKDALNKNKIKTKHSLKAKWYRSENATVQIALYKLICTDEERIKLSNHDKIDHTHKLLEPPQELKFIIEDPKEKE